MELFNPYWSARPPECCYCPPINPSPIAAEVNITTTIQGGFGSLSFMTQTEAAFRTIEETRQSKARGQTPPLWVEVGNGPWRVPWEG